MFTRRNTTIKTVIYALILVILYLFQSVPALGLRFMGCAPELMFILTVCVSYNESENFSAFFGLAAGLISDIVTGAAVGMNAIIFMFTAFFISVLLQTLLRRFFLTYISITLISLTVLLFLQYLSSMLFYGYIPLSEALLHVILPKLLFSGVLAYPVYFIVNFVNKKLDEGGEED